MKALWPKRLNEEKDFLILIFYGLKDLLDCSSWASYYRCCYFEILSHHYIQCLEQVTV